MSVLILTKIVTALRWAVGIAILAAAWLLKEDEEGRITNWLEEKRKAVAARRDQTLSKLVIHLQTIAVMLSRLFDGVFGKQLWSVNAIYVSMWLSLVGVGAVTATVAYLIRGGGFLGTTTMDVIYCLGLVLFSLLMALLPSKLAKDRKLRTTIQIVVASLVIAGPIFYLLYLDNIKGDDEVGAIQVSEIILSSYLLSLFSDILFVAVTRWVLNKIAAFSGVVSMIVLIAINVLLVLLLGGVPCAIVWLSFDTVPSDFGLVAWTTSLLLASSNVLDVLLSISIIIAAVLISLNALFWPLAERNLNSFNRYKILTKKKLLWTAGVALCSEPHIWTLVLKATKAGWF